MLKRILAAALALLMSLIALEGCGQQGTTKTNEDINNNTYAKAHFDKVVMTIGDIEITYETYRYLYMSCRNNYESKNITKTVDEIKAEVLEELFYESAVMTLANRYNANLTDKQKKDIDTHVQTLVNTYKEYGSDLDETLAENYMTQKVYKESYAFENYLTGNVFDYCKNKDNNILDFSEDAVDALMKQYNRVQMIYVSVGEARDDAAAVAKADGILKMLADGEDFEKTAKGYSDDIGSDLTVGVYFQPGEIDNTIETIYNTLNEGDYSKEAIKTENGYYIIRRVAADKKYFTENLYPYYAFNEMLKETKAGLSVVYTEFFTTMFDGKNLIPERKPE